MRAAIFDSLTGAGVLLPLAAFALIGVGIFLIASRLSRYADLIAAATGLGRLWIGTILLAASTSLPELTTDVNAALLGAADIAVGDLLGSTMANMLILATLDIVYARRRILETVAVDHVIVATVALILTGIAGIAVATGGWGRIGHVGLDTLLIFALYVIGMRVVFRATSRAAPAERHQEKALDDTALRRGLLGFVVATLGLLVLAPLLVISAQAIALEAGASDTAIGTLLVGFTTSFPEIAASIAAVRIGALDLAIGNLLGSNAFNMSVLFATDLFYLPGPLLANVAADHAVTALFGMVAIALSMLAILGRAARRSALVRAESVLVLAAY
ncbi:MAG: hypothetical protein NZM12_13635, partial [Steroidobacteraceae bacterium]|nr:hypothetical protein [Steroidobacteraceae bacterium]MDW8260230.1 hypothetical protein [Gammaproteobacteria bacterium]